jgi:hypothetical protein
VEDRDKEEWHILQQNKLGNIPSTKTSKRAKAPKNVQKMSNWASSSLFEVLTAFTDAYAGYTKPIKLH